MKRLLIGVLMWWGGLSVVWAGEYRVTVPQRTDFGELTTEAYQLVPTIRGGYENLPTNEVVFERESGDFTEAEKALIDQAVAAHDPQVKGKRKAQQQQRKTTAKTKLKALGLTEDELKALLNE